MVQRSCSSQAFQSDEGCSGSSMILSKHAKDVLLCHGIYFVETTGVDNILHMCRKRLRSVHTDILVICCMLWKYVGRQ